MYLTFYLIREIIFRDFVGHYSKPLFFQMAFAQPFSQRFNEVTSDITYVSDLEVCRTYLIERAEKVSTRFGETILLGIREAPGERLF